MSVLINKNTKVICQGFTGSQGTFHAEQARVRHPGGRRRDPGQGRHRSTSACRCSTPSPMRCATGADASVIYVPPPFAADAILEAADAGIKVIVCITEGIPVLDMLRVKNVLKGYPECADRPELPGRDHPGRMQDRHHAGPHPQAGQGRHRVALRHADLRSGQARPPTPASASRPASASAATRSTALNFIDCLKLFQDDPQTEGIIMVGEIGGSAEEEAAEFIKQYVTKPVVGFIAGASAPAGKRMGHAGAIISGGKGTAAASSPRWKRRA
jgi:succinyl-CoA synthetase alpha subunit